MQWLYASYSIGKPWDLPKWSECEGVSADSLCGHILSWWCQKVWWCHCVSCELLPWPLWCVVCSLAWHIWWCLVWRWYVLKYPVDEFVFQWVGWLSSWMSLTSLVAAVLVSQWRASPKKGKRLLLVHLLKVDMPLKEGSLFSSWVAVRMSGLYGV